MQIEQQFEKAMETITKFFKEEKDFLYRKGEEKGRELGRREGRELGEYRNSLASAAAMKTKAFLLSGSINLPNFLLKKLNGYSGNAFYRHK